MEALPPGIEGNLKECASGGSADWILFEKRKFYTNAFIVKDNKILLGYKKRGFGVGKYNGFGGKVESGETPAEAASRELKEEAGIEAPLEHAGSLLCVIEGIELAFQIEIYSARSYTGVLTETDEMRPEWFALPPSVEESRSSRVASDALTELLPIPYDKMWDDDIHWLPLLIRGQRFVGRADCKENGDQFTMAKWWFGTLED